MPALCRNCAIKADVSLPSFRVSREPCIVCRGFDERQTRNYSVEAFQLPGSTEDPNRQAEIEEMGKT